MDNSDDEFAENHKGKHKQDFWRSIDIFGSKVALTFKKQRTFKTYWGTLFTILFGVGLFSYLLVKVVVLVQRTDNQYFTKS